jgi:anaerobic magnesium-protoporphyrin IX monomethyl ester cyclase
MAHHGHVDYIVRGEGEETIKELFGALTNGQPLEDVRGLVLRNGKGFKVNPEREPISDLDSVRAAWELIEDWELYRNGVTNERMAVVGFSRGCPFSCEFCGQWNFWKQYRIRNPEDLLMNLSSSTKGIE